MDSRKFADEPTPQEQKPEEQPTVQILNARPEGMSYEDYKAHQRKQRQDIERRLKGRVVHFTGPSRMGLEALMEAIKKQGGDISQLQTGGKGTYRAPGPRLKPA